LKLFYAAVACVDGNVCAAVSASFRDFHKQWKYNLGSDLNDESMDTVSRMVGASLLAHTQELYDELSPQFAWNMGMAILDVSDPRVHHCATFVTISRM
jgi:hypothetical protein